MDGSSRITTDICGGRHGRASGRVIVSVVVILVWYSRLVVVVNEDGVGLYTRCTFAHGRNHPTSTKHTVCMIGMVKDAL